MISKECFTKKQIIYCFSTNGEKIHISNDNICIVDSNGITKMKTSCYRLFAIFVIGDATITTRVIKYAHKFAFSIVMMTTTFKVYDICGFQLDGNTLLHSRQYESKNIDIAKHFVSNKIYNQIQTLKHIREKSDKKTKSLEAINSMLLALEDKHTIASIMGIEGICAKYYFDVIFEDFSWQGRQPRIKRDCINATLDIGYTILFNYIETILHIYGFDVYRGFLHQEFYMRKSLVCDFVEPFRPIIDWQIRKSIHLGQFKSKDFKQQHERMQLQWKENKKYVSVFSTVINNHKESIFMYIQSFYRAFMRDKHIHDYPIARIYD